MFDIEAGIRAFLLLSVLLIIVVYAAGFTQAATAIGGDIVQLEYAATGRDASGKFQH